MNSILSDLAHDLDAGTLGVRRSTSYDENIEIVSTIIENDINNNGIIRRHGNYHAIDNAYTLDDTRLVSVTSRLLGKYLHSHHNIMIVGFGNGDYMCDRLGISALDAIDIGKMSGIYKVEPSVERETGVSSTTIVRGLVRELKPSLILAVDTLATSNIARLGNSIQITDAGISPGAGISGNSVRISEESVGVKVIAIGVPLVIALHNILDRNNVRSIHRYLTPSTIDSVVDKFGEVIGHSIMKALKS